MGIETYDFEDDNTLQSSETEKMERFSPISQENNHSERKEPSTHTPVSGRRKNKSTDPKDKILVDDSVTYNTHYGAAYVFSPSNPYRASKIKSSTSRTSDSDVGDGVLSP